MARFEKPLTICAWSKKVKIDDNWLSLEEFLFEILHINFSHGISPEMAEKVQRETKEALKASAD